MDKEKSFLKYIIFVLVLAILFLVGYIMYTDNLFGIKDIITPHKEIKEVEEKNIDLEQEQKEYIHDTNSKVKLNVTGEYYIYANLTVYNGKLLVETSKTSRDGVVDETYTKESKEVSLTDESIKYVYSQYDQRAQETCIYLLTDKGNLYINKFTSSAEQKLDVLDKFTKTDYNNISELVKVPNDNYGKESLDDPNVIDYNNYYLYVLVDNELVKVKEQFEIFN